MAPLTQELFKLLEQTEWNQVKRMHSFGKLYKLLASFTLTPFRLSFNYTCGATF